MSKLLGKYTNGNVRVQIYDDGTKIRETDDDEFRPAFAECMDVNITNYCTHNCSMCYQNCSDKGQHADFDKYARLIDSLHQYTEVAINYNSDGHPNLIPFLCGLRANEVFANITIHQQDFETNFDWIKCLVEKKLVRGVGVSLMHPTVGFIDKVKQLPNVVIHVINGIVSASDIKKLSDHGLKLLILGYKKMGRGEPLFGKSKSQIESRMEWLDRNLPIIQKHFELISFDNLAVEQLSVRRLVDEETWNSRFLGDDGTSSFYINLVDGYFARNSLSITHYPIGDKTVDECFEVIQKEVRGE